MQAWVVGPGVGDDADAVAAVLKPTCRCSWTPTGCGSRDRDVVRARTAPTLLTPHAGEAAALLGVARDEVEGARLTSVRELAARYGATVLLKGSTTLVADPGGGPVRVNSTGTAWLATAGSGDVLSGLTGSLLAAGLGALDAGSAGAYLHGLAGRFAADGAPVGAHDVAEAVREAWRDVMASGTAPAAPRAGVRAPQRPCRARLTRAAAGSPRVPAALNPDAAPGFAGGMVRQRTVAVLAAVVAALSVPGAVAAPSARPPRAPALPRSVSWCPG